MTRPHDAPYGTDRHPTDLLTGYLLAELPEHEMEALEAHLASCETCSGELTELDAAFVTAVEALPDAPAPAGAWERIEARTAGVVPAP
ncbi:MAG: zf-HC2 domain-containing protein, partial [Trueperaceae bacterium]